MEDNSPSHRANYTVQVKTQYMCSYCGRMFTNLSAMQTHVATHSRGVNDCCSCHVCGKTYNTPSKLRRHVRTHTGEKPYPCQICGRCFGRSDHLKQHMKVHFMTSKRQKNLCRLCGMMFLKTDTLLTHLTEHGVQSVHSCGLCGEVFDSTEKLEQHEKGHLKDTQGELTPDGKGSLGLGGSRLPIDTTSLSDISGLMEQHGGDPENVFAELMLGVARFSSSSTSGINSISNTEQMTPSSTDMTEPNSSVVSSNMIFNFDTPCSHSSLPMFPRNMAYERSASADERELLQERMQISSTYTVGDAQTESSDAYCHEKFSPSGRAYSSSSNFYSPQSKRMPIVLKEPTSVHLGLRQQSEIGFCRNIAEPESTVSCEVHTVSDDEGKVEVRRPRKGRPVALGRASNVTDMQGEENSSLGESEISSQLIHDDDDEEEEAISEGQLDCSLDHGEDSCKGTKHHHALTVTLGGEDSESEGDRQLSSTPGSLADLSILSGHLPQSSMPEIHNRSLTNQRLKDLHVAAKPPTSVPVGANRMRLEVQQYRHRHPSTMVSSGTHREAAVMECQGAPGPVGRGYRCHHCRIWFEDYSMCLLHNSLHANSGQTPFICVKCGKRLGNRLEFTAHLIWHLTPNMDIS